jgi:hypothetical protein
MDHLRGQFGWTGKDKKQRKLLADIRPGSAAHDDANAMLQYAKYEVAKPCRHFALVYTAVIPDPPHPPQSDDQSISSGIAEAQRSVGRLPESRAAARGCAKQ